MCFKKKSIHKNIVRFCPPPIEQILIIPLARVFLTKIFPFIHRVYRIIKILYYVQTVYNEVISYTRILVYYNIKNVALFF